MKSDYDISLGGKTHVQKSAAWPWEIGRGEMGWNAVMQSTRWCTLWIYNKILCYNMKKKGENWS